MIRKVELYLMAGIASGLVAGPLSKYGVALGGYLGLYEYGGHLRLSPISLAEGILLDALDFSNISACLFLALVFFAIEPYLHKFIRHVCAAALWASYSISGYLLRGIAVLDEIPLSKVLIAVAFSIAGLFFVVILDRLKKRYSINASLVSESEESNTRDKKLTEVVLLSSQFIGACLIVMWAGTLMFTPMLFDSGASIESWIAFILWLSIPVWLLVTFTISWGKYHSGRYSIARLVAVAPFSIPILYFSYSGLRHFLYKLF